MSEAQGPKVAAEVPAEAQGPKVAAEVPAELSECVSGVVSRWQQGDLEFDGAGVPVLQVALDQWLAAAQDVHDQGFRYFDWLSAVDQQDQEVSGVDVVAHVVRLHGPEASDATAGDASAGSSRVADRLMLRVRVPDESAELSSVVSVWPGAAWHERETFEMFGVTFLGFEEAAGMPLVGLLLPDGFEGTPLRKSFVLTARASKPWPGAKDPGESDARPAAKAPGRRRTTPPGVPDPSWGPHEPQDAAAAQSDAGAGAEAGEGTVTTGSGE